MSERESISYLKILLYIAASDRNISEDEMAYFNKAGKELNIPDSEISDIINSITNGTLSIENAAREITDKDTKLSLVEELLNICYADGNYSLAEKIGISDICILLNIESEDLQKLERKIEAKNKIRAMINNSKSAGDKLIGKVFSAFNYGKINISTAGQKIADGSSELAHAISSGVSTIGSKISLSMENVKRTRQENAELREKLKSDTVSEAVKQKVIAMLHSKIRSLNEQLQEEKNRNDQNEEMIKMLQEQLADLESTMETAQKAKIA